MYKITSLKNGLKIVSNPMPEMQSVAVGVWSRVGGRYENNARKGIAHYLEHLVFKGSRKYSCRKLKESIEGVGGSLNGFTSEEVTCYLAKLPYRYLSVGVDVLCDMSLRPMLRLEDVEKERTVILEEIKMYKDLPQMYVHDILDHLMWPDHPLGWPVIGTHESVSGISQGDIAAFQKQYYSPQNMVVSAAGAFKHDELVRMIERAFKGAENQPCNGFLEVAQAQYKSQVRLMHKETEQSHMALGFHSFKRDHPLKYATTLMNIIMGANMSSRLFNEVREKRGFAYEIASQLKRFHDTGAYVVHAGMDNQKVIQCLEVIIAELRRVRETLVTLDEFKRAKEFFLGQLSLALEDTLDNMLWVGESVSTMEKIFTLSQIIREVKRVTREDIRRAAREIIHFSRANFALIGPQEGQQSAIEGLLKE